MLLYVFSSDKCIPCNQMKNNLKNDNIPFVEMNFDKMDDDTRKWATGFQIRSLPTLVIMDDKKTKVEKFLTGTVPTNQIKKFLSGDNGKN